MASTMNNDLNFDVIRAEELNRVTSLILSILHELGCSDVDNQSIIFSSSKQPPALLNSDAEFNQFNWRFVNKTVCIGYAASQVSELTVEAFAQRYIDDSFPLPPSHALTNNQYRFVEGRHLSANVAEALDMPIVFVLGCPRSGTTLFRAMLNSHPALWAPGELHLAHFDTMADRAMELPPFIKSASIPELGKRFEQTSKDFAATLADWEAQALTVSEVYSKVHLAAPDQLIVDKTNSYGNSLQYLLRLKQMFRNAKFIWMVRNPYDVIKSFVKMQLTRAESGLFEADLNPYHRAEIMWSIQNENIKHFLNEIPQQQQFSVRYESLVAEPQTTLKPLCEWLDIPYYEAMANPYGEKTKAIAKGAGDLYVNSHGAVLNRKPSEAFYPMGERSNSMAEQLGY